MSGSRRRTSLVPAGLGAAGLLALAVLVVPRLADDDRPPCRDAAVPGGGATIAADSGSHVIGLTTRPGDRETTVQVVGAAGPTAAEDLTASGRGLAGDARETSTIGCYAVEGVPAPGAPVTITGRAEGEAVSARLTPPPPGAGAADLLGRARRATSRLHAVRERQRVARRADGPPVRVRVDYRGSGYVVRSEDRPPRQARAPAWRGSFYWMDPADYLLVRRIGDVRRGGRDLVRLSGYLRLPLWLEIEVDPRTGLVHRQRMHAASHFMTSAFDRFAPSDRRGSAP